MLKIQPLSPNLTFKEKLAYFNVLSLYYWTELPDFYFPSSSLFNSAYKGGVNNYQGSVQANTEKCIQSKCHLCPAPLHGTCHRCTCWRCPIALGPRNGRWKCWEARVEGSWRINAPSSLFLGWVILRSGTDSYWLPFSPCLTSSHPINASWNHLPNKRLHPKSVLGQLK